MQEISIDWLSPICPWTRDHTRLDWGLNLQTRHVPSLGIEPATPWLWDDAATNRAIPARALCKFLHGIHRLFLMDKENPAVLIGDVILPDMLVLYKP